jgi:hypothetical protein
LFEVQIRKSVGKIVRRRNEWFLRELPRNLHYRARIEALTVTKAQLDHRLGGRSLRSDWR